MSSPRKITKKRWIMEEETFIVTFRMKSLRKCSSVRRYKILDTANPYNIERKEISALSFSGMLPDVLYLCVSTYKGEVLLMCDVSTLTVTEMEIDLKKRGFLHLQCSKEFTYVGSSRNHCTVIHKCVVDNQSSLRAINSNSFSWDYSSFIGANNGQLYTYVENFVVIIDSDTLTEIRRIQLRRTSSSVHSLALHVDGTLAAAGSWSDQFMVSQYDGEGAELNNCCVANGVHRKTPRYVTCTNSGKVIVSADYSKPNIYILSKDLTLKQSLSPIHQCTDLKCNPLDDTLAIMEGESFLLLPREVYHPPFSLTTLCVSAVLQHADVLLVTYLPPGIQRLFRNYLHI